MKRSIGDAIEFPANPFVAFVDFLVVLVIVLIVMITYQSINSSSLKKRAAIANTQMDLNSAVVKLPANVSIASRGAPLQEYAVDGDLQRFRLQGSLCFPQNSDQLTLKGRAVLQAFGKELARRQGNPYDNATRPFKRITVSGHADASEGSEARLWELSSKRAQAAISVLRQQCNINPTLLEVSARGAYEPAMNPGVNSPQQVAEANRRLEIVIVYSGQISLQYLAEHVGAPGQGFPTP